ncbi:luciferase-like domain-containing protein [Aspergillus venezuelensis]
MTTKPTSVHEGGPTLKGPLDYPSSLLRHFTRQPLMLGVFLDMQDRHISSFPTSNMRRVRKLRHRFSRMQWLPKGGYDGEASLDAFVALGAMAAATSKILLISTIHVLYGPLHPLHITKFDATLDHISQARWGINVVTGHREIEHQLFGWNRIEHDRRYETAGEIAGRLFGFGVYYVAGGCGYWESLGREIKVLINPVVVSKDTAEETWAYLQNILDGMDEGGGGMRVVRSYESDAHAWRGHKSPGKQGYKLGGDIEVIGTPKEVVGQLVALHGVGIDGVMLGFHDWKADFDHFMEKILPLLKEAGLRVD